MAMYNVQSTHTTYELPGQAVFIHQKFKRKAAVYVANTDGVWLAVRGSIPALGQQNWEA